ncbi:uncharacterized protein LOC127802407 [Diospyros lotus]|uniref:uncharacterized protein LOC127802407 n=1 Tax=Diospyros lotus TaxID=55363 RepID=UPI00225296FC|nr:uncharacterized protein LOC127802407 [Diospyros lotus]
MGNCVFRGAGVAVDDEDNDVRVKVVTSNGGIMELYPPITAECITDEFPGHRLFRTRDLFSDPLVHNEQLNAGELYYLLPAFADPPQKPTAGAQEGHSFFNQLNISTATSTATSMVTPYRMSLDNYGGGGLLKRSDAEVFPRYNSAGVWKVKLVISPDQLSEILSQEARTEALIESVRTVAKCGNGGLSVSSASSVANSDQG